MAYLLPCYSSVTSIRKNDSDKQKQWITYWWDVLLHFHIRMILLVSECIFSISNLLFNEYANRFSDNQFPTVSSPQTVLCDMGCVSIEWSGCKWIRLKDRAWSSFLTGLSTRFFVYVLCIRMTQNHSEEISSALHHALTVLCNKLKEVLNKAIDSIPSLVRAASKVQKRL